MKAIKIISMCLVLAVSSITLQACSGAAEKTPPEEVYSRETVAEMIATPGLVGDHAEDIPVAFDYLYHDEALRASYGDSFAACLLGGDTALNGFLWISTGDTQYRILIQAPDHTWDLWTVALRKEYFGKWTVTDCRLQKKDCREEYAYLWE